MGYVDPTRTVFSMIENTPKYHIERKHNNNHSSPSPITRHPYVYLKDGLEGKTVYSGKHKLNDLTTYIYM